MGENLSHWKFDDLKRTLADYDRMIQERFELEARILNKYNTILHLMNEGLTKITKDKNA